MLEKRMVETRTPKYLLCLYVKKSTYSSNKKSDISANWHITVNWQANEGRPKEFVFEHSKTFTESEVCGHVIDSTPGKSSVLEISVKITKWTVTKRSDKKFPPGLTASSKTHKAEFSAFEVLNLIII